MENEINALVYSKNVVEFVTVANEYCAFVENATDLDNQSLIQKLPKILALLYLKASILPIPSVELEDDNEKFVSELDWQIAKNGIEALLDESDVYLDFFDQDMNELPEPVAGSISENTADIYQDLKDLLEIYKLGNEELSFVAINTCNINFREFWGFKLVTTLKMLHILNFSKQGVENKLHKLNTQRDKDQWFLSKAQQDFQQND